MLRGRVRILAMDTATNACSVALWRDGTILGHELVPMVRGHAEALMPMVTRVMAAAGAKFSDLDRLAVTVGPGAFTGVRIGLAAARGLALAAKLPLVGVTTLEALARATDPDARRGTRILATIDAKRADVYVQMFDAELTPVSPPQSVVPDDLPAFLGEIAQPLLLTGDGTERIRPVLADGGIEAIAAGCAPWPDAAVVAAIAAGRDGPVDMGPAPLYLRPPQASRPAHGGRLRP